LTEIIQKGDRRMDNQDKDLLFAAIQAHLGHHIVAASYGGDYAPDNVAIECEDCGEVIIDVDGEEYDQNETDNS